MVSFLLIDSMFIPRRLIAPFADDGGLATWKYHSSKYKTFSRREQTLPFCRFNSILTAEIDMPESLPAFQTFIRGRVLASSSRGMKLDPRSRHIGSR